MGPSGHFYSHMDPVWSLLIVRTGFVPWVELPVQRRLCPIFLSGVGLSTDPREMGRHKEIKNIYNTLRNFDYILFSFIFFRIKQNMKKSFSLSYI